MTSGPVRCLTQLVSLGPKESFTGIGKSIPGFRGRSIPVHTTLKATMKNSSLSPKLQSEISVRPFVMIGYSPNPSVSSQLMEPRFLYECLRIWTRLGQLNQIG